jgi:hypothetical protein
VFRVNVEVLHDAVGGELYIVLPEEVTLAKIEENIEVAWGTDTGQALGCFKLEERAVFIGNREFGDCRALLGVTPYRKVTDVAFLGNCRLRFWFWWQPKALTDCGIYFPARHR